MYEYRVIEAPVAARKGFFKKPQPYAALLSDVINEMALDNWEYQRAEADLGAVPLLVFRKSIKKMEEELGATKSFSDRLLEAENKGSSDHERGKSYGGPVKPRRARVLLDDEGTITERPANKEPEFLKLESAESDGRKKERVTPMKPKAATAANV